MKQKGVDPECVMLAKYFLEDEGGLDTPANIEQLAQNIQEAVEDFFSGLDLPK